MFLLVYDSKKSHNIQRRYFISKLVRLSDLISFSVTQFRLIPLVTVRCVLGTIRSRAGNTRFNESLCLAAR